jgi:hypothetical protein
VRGYRIVQQGWCARIHPVTVTSMGTGWATMPRWHPADMDAYTSSVDLHLHLFDRGAQSARRVGCEIADTPAVCT